MGFVGPKPPLSFPFNFFFYIFYRYQGAKVEPGRPLALKPSYRNGKLRVSLATLGEGSLSTKSVLQCNIGDSAPVLLCSLLPEKSETVPLNLHFGEEEDVVLSVLGPRSIHLSGYHIGSSNGHDENKSDSYGEDIKTGSEMDEKSNYDDSEDKYDDDFIDDDEPLEVDASPKHASGAKNEEIKDDKQKPGRANDASNLLKHQSYPTSKRRKVVIISSDSEDEDGVGENPADNEKSLCIGSKRENDSFSEDETLNKEGDRSGNGMMMEGPGSGPGMSVSIASNDAYNAQDQSGQVYGADDGEHGNTAALTSAAGCGVVEVGRVKKRKNKKKKFHAETDKDIDGNRSKLATSGNRQGSEKVPLVEDHVDELPTQGGRTFPKGLIVEETCRGKPDGKCEWRNASWR
ncbi:unnamed protein product [Victoria cruziana]